MKGNKRELAGILTAGVGYRLAVVAVLVVALWMLHFWATSSPGGI